MGISSFSGVDSKTLSTAAAAVAVKNGGGTDLAATGAKKVSRASAAAMIAAAGAESEFKENPMSQLARLIGTSGGVANFTEVGLHAAEKKGIITPEARSKAPAFLKALEHEIAILTESKV